MVLPFTQGSGTVPFPELVFQGAPCSEPICLGRGRKGVIALRERGHLWEEPQVSLITVSGPMGLGILEKAG